MGLTDFWSRKQQEMQQMTDSEYLKMDTELSTRVKKRLTSLEGTVKEMKSHEAKLQEELQKAEDFKYGRVANPMPDYTGMGFADFLTASAKSAEAKHPTKTPEQVRAEQRELLRYKERFLDEKLKEINADLRELRYQQEAKLEAIETMFETVTNKAEVDELYNVIVAEYHKLVQRVYLIVIDSPRQSFSLTRERIGRKTLIVRGRSSTAG